MATIFGQLKDLLISSGAEIGAGPITLEAYTALVGKVEHQFGEHAASFVKDCFMPEGEPIEPGFEDSLSHYRFFSDNWEEVERDWIDSLKLSSCEPWDGLNGARVELSGKTFFIALPRHLWRPLGRCSCPYCTEDNKRPGMGFWDTLAVSAESGHAWTVHRPESHGAKPKRAYT